RERRALTRRGWPPGFVYVTVTDEPVVESNDGRNEHVRQYHSYRDGSFGAAGSRTNVRSRLMKRARSECVYVSGKSIGPTSWRGPSASETVPSGSRRRSPTVMPDHGLTV